MSAEVGLAGGLGAAQTRRVWMSARDLAGELGVPLRTVYHWHAEGTGPKAHRFGRHLRFRREDVDLWVQAQAEHR